MPESPRDILRRIRGIKSTQQITKAMEMVAAVKLTKVRNQAENSRAYVESMGKMMRTLCTTAGGIDNPLFYGEKTRMLFGDAKDSLTKLIREVNNA